MGAAATRAAGITNSASNTARMRNREARMIVEEPRGSSRGMDSKVSLNEGTVGTGRKTRQWSTARITYLGTNLLRLATEPMRLENTNVQARPGEIQGVTATSTENRYGALIAATAHRTIPEFSRDSQCRPAC